MKNQILAGGALLLIIGFITITTVVIPVNDNPVLVSSFLASAHFLSLPFGLGGVFLRGIYLQKDLTDTANLKRAFTADNAWGIAAAVWIGTGLFRAFGSYEKGPDYYVHNPMFHLKMGLFILIFLLELWPMVMLIIWRLKVRKGLVPETARAAVMGKISIIESLGLVFMVFIAGFMARGIFG